MKAIVKLVVVLLAALWPSVLWADPAVTISWPGSYDRGSLKLTLVANDGTGAVTYTKTVPYGEFSTAGSLAGALGAHISMSPDWPVWAKGNPDGTVLMKARGSGITISNLSVCAIPSGAGDCGSTPSGANLAGNPSNVVPAGVSLDGALYGYSITDTNGNSGYDAAGNITAYQDTVNQRWTLAYDTLNRLASASQYYYTAAFPTPAAPGGGMQQFFCWVYDSFGNRQRQAVSGTPFSDFSSCNPPGSDSVTMDQQYAGGTNRLTSAPGLAFAYDDAGNIIEDGRFKYLYNEEGKLCAVMANATAPYGATGYLYNAEGQRVAKGSLSSFSCDFSSNGFTMTNEYIPGPDGNMLTEVAWSGSTPTPLRTYAYAGGQLAATLDSNGTHYQLSDWLGSRRVQQKDGSTPAEVTCGNQPFGDGQTCSDAVPQHFTGKERDQESGLDYFGARYYGSSTGRFTSPDDGSDQNPFNPQSWNLYSYGRNNPLIGTDDDGHTYNVCPPGAASGSPQCTNIDDITFEAEQKQDQANGVSYAHGTISDSRGVQGTYTHDPDIAGDPSANIAAMGNVGNQGMGAINWFAQQMVVNAATDGLVGVAGAALEASPLATQIGRNALKGAAGEATAKAILRMRGYKILGEQVSVMTSAGRRVVDFVVEKDGEMLAIEVKTGDAVRSARQLAKDAAMESEGARVGASGGALAGQTLKLRTIEMRPF